MGEVMMLVGGVMLLVSALMLIYILAKSSLSVSESVEPQGDSLYAEALRPVLRLPATLNGFGFWSIVVILYLIVGYGYPIGQFFFIGTHGTPPFGV
jgi:hypothetical protein